jgi:uncharacterized protein (TIGR04551 family)
MRARTLSLLAFAAAVAAARPAGATGFIDAGQDIASQNGFGVAVGGYLRLRGELLHNLDLDRGLTPSGRPIFPVPASGGQQFITGDFRLRTDLALYAAGSRVPLLAPGSGVAVKLRVDVIDNLAFGSTPDGTPASTTMQRSPSQAAFRIKRAYGEVLTPIGLIAAGRVGNHWGLGMLSNGGDCWECDSGDSADRVALITPMFGHLLAFAYDFSSSGPIATRKDGVRPVDLEPTDNVHTVSFAVLRFKSELTRERRRQAGLTTVEYGAVVTHRWQDNDVPASYLPVAQARPLVGADLVARGLSITGVDGWFRISHPYFRIEAEGAALFGRISQPSLIPGVSLPKPVDSTQIGVAVETDFGPANGPVQGGLDFGYASGDPAPGFGAYPGLNQGVPRKGDLDGPQAIPPNDYRVDNFRFHPDYRIDRILFREIIGTVTDAIYVRPHIRWRIARLGRGELALHTALVASMAADPSSTLTGARPLGVELDPTLSYNSGFGLGIALEYAVLFPLAGLNNIDNPAMPIPAKPAQLGRLRATFAF